MEVSIKSFLAEDGAEIKYVDEGNGIPFLFIYGMGSNLASQQPFVEFMRNYCRIIMFDQRGYGITKGVGEIGIHQSAKDANALMTHLNIDQFILMGYSMGAAVVFSYINQFGCEHLIKVLTGDMSPKLINEDGWDGGLYQGHYTRQWYEEDLGTIDKDYEKMMLYLTEQLMFKHTPESPREEYASAEEIKERILAKEHNPLIREALFNGMVYVSEEQKQLMKDYWVTMASADFRKTLTTISVPTAILYADPGAGYSPKTAEFMHTQIPNSMLCPLHDCSHMMSAENPSLYRKYILDFCGF